jgi:basic membrane protein A
MTVVRTAENNGAYSVGSNDAYSVGSQASLSKFAPRGWLTGQVWNWGPLYVKIAESVLDHTWKPGNQFYGMKDDYVTVAPFGAEVPAAVRREANSIKKQIEDGSLIVFKGPIKDRDGKLRIKSGETLDAKALNQVDWVVEGVEGALVKK